MSSKRRVRKRACTTKRRYETAPEAQRQVFNQMHVYRCPFSKGGPAHFHVGHQPLHLKQSARARAIGAV